MGVKVGQIRRENETGEKLAWVWKWLQEGKGLLSEMRYRPFCREVESGCWYRAKPQWIISCVRLIWSDEHQLRRFMMFGNESSRYKTS